MGLSPELLEAFNDFLAMRKKIKKPATERAVKLLLSKLEKMSDNEQERIAIIDQSIINCWQDLYPLKNNTGNKMDNLLKNILK